MSGILTPEMSTLFRNQVAMGVGIPRVLQGKNPGNPSFSWVSDGLMTHSGIAMWGKETFTRVDLA